MGNFRNLPQKSKPTTFTKKWESPNTGKNPKNHFNSHINSKNYSFGLKDFDLVQWGDQFTLTPILDPSYLLTKLVALSFYISS